MNLTQLMPENIMKAIGMALLHSLWQGALAAIILAVLMVLLKKQSSHLRYWASVGALAVVVLLPLMTFLHEFHAQTDTYQKMQTVFSSMPSESSEKSFQDTAFLEKDGVFYAGFTSYTNYFQEHLPMIVTLWLMGVLILTLRLLGGLALVERMKNYKVNTVSNLWQKKVDELAAKLQISNKIRLLESGLAKVPMVIGHFKPVILLPIGMLSGLTPAQVEAILAHELAHISRNDYLINILQSVAEVIFFYHPAIWWISGQIRTEREHCCDDIALSLQQDGVALAKALTEIEIQIQQGGILSPQFAMAFSGKKEKLYHRIKRLFMPIAMGSQENFKEGFFSAFVLMAGLAIMSFTFKNKNSEQKTETTTNVQNILDNSFLMSGFMSDSDTTKKSLKDTYNINTVLDDGSYLFARFDKNDKIVDLFVNGMAVSDSERGKYEEIARKTKKDMENLKITPFKSKKSQDQTYWVDIDDKGKSTIKVLTDEGDTIVKEKSDDKFVFINPSSKKDVFFHQPFQTPHANGFYFHNFNGNQKKTLSKEDFEKLKKAEKLEKRAREKQEKANKLRSESSVGDWNKASSSTNYYFYGDDIDAPEMPEDVYFSEDEIAKIEWEAQQEAFDELQKHWKEMEIEQIERIKEIQRIENLDEEERREMLEEIEEEMQEMRKQQLEELEDMREELASEQKERSNESLKHHEAMKQLHKQMSIKREQMLKDHEKLSKHHVEMTKKHEEMSKKHQEMTKKHEEMTKKWKEVDKLIHQRLMNDGLCKKGEMVNIEISDSGMKLNNKILDEKVAEPYYEIIRRITGDDLKKDGGYRMIMSLGEEDKD
jgi:beta-lactamase regulating signal transducer with metallopeptidase domain